MTIIEVDQSIKFNDLSRDTVLAYSDHLSRTILVPAQVKRILVEQLRARGKSKIRATLQLFVVGLFLLLEDVLPQVSLIVIDTEYTGYEADVEGMLLNYLRKVEPEFSKERLLFQQIGKSSPAHRQAISTHRGKIRPDRILRLEDFLNVLGWK